MHFFNVRTRRAPARRRTAGVRRGRRGVIPRTSQLERIRTAVEHARMELEYRIGRILIFKRNI